MAISPRTSPSNNIRAKSANPGPRSKARGTVVAVQQGRAAYAPTTLQTSAITDPVVAEKKLAMAWLHTAHFLTTAAQLHHLPELNLPEIAFVGRSNAGKSTCINTITQQKQLAYASKTPGRTQHINLFSVGKNGVHDGVLADLPGYGYAAVPKSAKYRWQQVMANYLVSRPQLKAVVMLCDPRHGITELDEVLLEVIRPRVTEGLKFLILLTKADKLSKNEAAKAMSIARLQAGGGQVMMFSAPKRVGVEETAVLLRQWMAGGLGELQAAQAVLDAQAAAAALLAQSLADGTADSGVVGGARV